MRYKWQKKKRLSTNIIANIKFHQTYRVEVKTTGLKASTRNEFCLAYTYFSVHNFDLHITISYYK